MSLTALPNELVSRVCRFLGREPIEYGKRIVYKNKDFQSLRSTCRDIYGKTTYDASVRYSLDELTFHLNPSPLALFLHLSNIPVFRNRMKVTYLYPEKPPVLGANNSDSEDQLIRFLQSEDVYSFVRTGEAVHILAQCLRSLRHTTSLGSLIYRAENFDVIGQTAVLRALEVSRYPRKLAKVYIHLNAIREPGWPRSADSLPKFQPYLKGALFDTPETLLENNRNKAGCHIQGFHLSHSDLHEVMTATRDVEHLEICGCAF
jgi:hypothetical protein